jgi:hypothetical protein
VPWQVIAAMLLVIVTVIALLVRATSKNPAGRTRAEAEARANEILAASVSNDVERPQRSGQQVPGRAGGAHQPVRMLAEHLGGAYRARAVVGSAF